MIGGKNQGAIKPTALGSMLQASTYGQTIPTIYGMTQSPLLAIWAANLRQGGSVKKFKQMKKGITTYVENIDFLIGHNPIMGVMQMWNNGSLYPLTFTSQSFTASGGRQSFVVSDSNFYAVVGVTLTITYSATFNDYGGQGSEPVSGSYEVPLWNELETGPDPTDPMSYRYWPFCYRWQPSYGDTIYVDAAAFPAGTLKVYYAQLMAATSNEPPIQKLRLAFEPQLGSGSEYADANLATQQIVYPMFAGLGSSDIDLGSGGVIPQLQAEVKGKWGIYSTGDGDFADMIEDVFKSGLAQAAIGATPATTQLERGLSSYDLPGTIQKKTDSSTATALPPMQYDMPNAAGDALVVICNATGTLSISSSNGETWTPVLGSALGFQVWYANAAGGTNINTVTISGASGAWGMTILEVGGAGTVESNGAYSAGTGQASFSLVKTGSASSVTGSSVSCYFTGFELQGSLPADAVIQGIYPVCQLVGSLVDGAFWFWVYGTNLAFSEPGGFYPVGTGFQNPAGATPGGTTTELWANSIGTQLGALAGQQIGFSVADTRSYNEPGNNWIYGGMYPQGSSDALGGTCGFAIYYTSATPSTPTSPMPPPFAVPSGQGVIWAVPTAGAGYMPYPWIIEDRGEDVYEVQDANMQMFVAAGPNSGQTWGINMNPSTPMQLVNAGGASVTSTVTQGQPALLMAIPFYASSPPADLELPQWDLDTPPNLYANTPAGHRVHTRIVHTPGTYNIDGLGTPSQLVTLAFKSSNPVSYPRPVGDYIDQDSLNQVRLQCRANGLWGSLSMNSQAAASEWLKTLYAAADAAPVFMGSKLYSFPYSEVSAAGNGAIYNAPTAAGPVANLDADNGDFVGSDRPIKVKTASRVNLPNVLQMQCLSRSSNYAQAVVSQPDAASIALYGVRKADPIVNNAVQDAAIARQLLAIQVRRNQYGGDIYSFTINSKWTLLAPMDLITVTDRLAGIVKVAVRLTSMQEQDDGSQACDAEPFIYGMCAPSALSTVNPSQNLSSTTESAGNVNAPVIFEPVPRLYANQNQAQLWVVVSSNNASYGGCQVYISTDGGNSYNPAGDPLIGSAITGVTTADWPAAADPDTTNNLALNLSASNGTLESYQTSDEDNFLYPCYVAGGGSNAITYELMTYAVATMTAANQYTLEATGTGNHLRRTVFGAPRLGSGVDHLSGSRFAFLPPGGAGILKLAMDPTWIGKTLYFKIASFNTFGGAAQSLTGLTAYSYTPTGAGGSVNAAGLPVQGFQINGN